MRIKVHDTGYVLWLSARDTYDWATRPGAAWPCSQLSDHRCVVVVDSNGLCDFTLDGRDADVDGNELDACVADHIPQSARKFWPTWD
jgi:hypothetical protein